MTEATKRPPVVTAGASGLSSFKENAETPSTTCDTTSKQQAAASSWRDVFQIHPAAAEFDLMGPEELVALGEDIKARGLLNPIVYYVLKLDADSPDERFLLDGRNRLDAMRAVGLGVTLTWRGGDLRMTVTGLSEDAVAVPDPIRCEADPYEYVISANIRRRHLNAEQRAEAIAKIIARAPGKSDRRIAKEIGVDHKTVGAARAKGEDVGRIPHVETRVDTRGRRQPGAKPPARSRGAAQPRSPRPGGRRKPDAAPPKLNSLSWSMASEEERERFVAALGFDAWWGNAPPEWRARARSTIEADHQAPPNQLRPGFRQNDAPEVHKDETAAGTWRNLAPPGSLLKPEKRRGGR